MSARAPDAAVTFAALGLAWLAGTGLQLQQPALWAFGGYATLAVAAAALAVLLRRLRGASRLGLLVIGVAGLAFALTGLRAGARLAEALPAELEGRDVVVIGVVDGLPQRGPEAWRFRLAVESARLDGAPVDIPRRLALGWYGQGPGAALPTLRAGQRWQLVLRLKRPHGARNPHGYDYELHLFEQGLRATGYVRPHGHRLLAEAVSHPVDRARQAVRDAIDARVGDPSAAGVLAALAVGDQSAIEREDWSLYRDTGVAHLMSISGLHVTMFAWLAGLLFDRLWRCSARAMLWCPAPRASRWGGLAAALAYAVFAGWGVPAQRTVWMLATTTVLGTAGLRWGWPLVWGSAAVVVAAADPWALLQPGFWLSFVAVGLLMGSGAARPLVAAASGLAPPETRSLRLRVGRLLAGGLRTQAVATLGLAPLTLVFFQQLSLVGFAANLVAIPLVTLLVTPLALLGVLWAPLWSAGAAAVGALNGLLQVLAAPAWAVWQLPAAPAWAAPCALLGAAVALLPLPWTVRLLAVPLLLPLLAPAVHRPAEGAYELTAVDVGQGTAVLLRTARHTLLYDAGPQYSREADAGERVLLPLLRALGERRLDALVLSHRDTDHVGGAAALLRGVPVVRLASSLEPAHPLLARARERGVAVAPCQAGGRWRWDGVDFEWLHPGPELLARSGWEKTKANTLSCVLKVSGRWDGRAQRSLLPGDIEREQELALVAARGAALAAEVLLVPHHGSKTSSSEPFLDAVAPRTAVVQAGYRNRFGHPAPAVAARYAERGIALIDSPRCGAWRFGPGGAPCWRTLSRRYWHHPEGRGRDNGLEVANSLVPADDPAAED
ncbi:MAG TPA: DNA internalization-related competence protein ComEC/Rec2 [Methylibium sp.]|nr:DNA internalization-related competence protein ComEC/Rec2 [Methylibium sp.]